MKLYDNKTATTEALGRYISKISIKKFLLGAQWQAKQDEAKMQALVDALNNFDTHHTNEEIEDIAKGRVRSNITSSDARCVIQLRAALKGVQE